MLYFIHGDQFLALKADQFKDVIVHEWQTHWIKRFRVFRLDIFPELQ